ncbi:MAG: transposase [Planctomycetes bacterium]|nr:transposase [Planctomycetota bacterium]
MQYLNPARTSWHITFGTYGTRLHYGPRPTVDRQYNRRGALFLPHRPAFERVVSNRLNHSSRCLTEEQQVFVEELLPALCERGGWDCRTGSASADHVHLLCDIVPEVHGERVRRLLKRWLGQALAQVWPLESGQSWWADGGSNKAVREHQYLNHVYSYILRQRTTPQTACVQ